MQFFDHLSLGQTAEIANAREMRNGSVVIQAKAARGGNVQDYLGIEVGKPEMPIVRVYRDADEVFRADSLRTFGHKPVTLDHPAQPVTPATWRDVARGHVGEEVLRDGEFVRIPMLLADQSAIDAVKAGKRELSVGYQCDLDWTPGTTPDGRAYDARQTNIVVDHVAIVDRGRAGPDCRIGDQRPADAKTMRALSVQQQQRDAIPMKTLTIDGHTVEMSDAAVVAVSGLQKQIGQLTTDNLSLTKQLNEANTTHAQAIEAKDGELAAARKTIEAKDGEIAVLKKQVEDAALTPDKLAAAVAARASVIDVAKTVIGATFMDAGKTDAQIRREVVSARLGDSAKDLTDGAVEGAFLAIAKDAKPADPLARTIADGVQPTAGPKVIEDAYNANVDYLTNAWKNMPARAAQ
ncbi:DUF2213 domain-containing protein [Methylobacterium nodulans]|uniref:DUF2213 domain-containing protein n=1 Tax=Methylobacterium nodulans (strain LMG 21967 / CNCM I-2342 / ORS 2060) TaxID=460265 RepID=B8IIU8_METNO|nr:DUF2213 domain-containing protein [Methylobacterium nodulans]ACL61743.1 conserved hypothetical protein [Methylobacterium nodulans ORS 2060]